MTKSLVLRVPMRCSWEQGRVLACWNRSVVVADRSREHSGSFLGARDLLATLLSPHWRRTEWVPPRGHAPWGQGAFLRGRRLRRGAVQREGRRGGAPCGADELGDAVEPLFVDVVDWVVAQELVCRDEHSSSLHGRAEISPSIYLLLAELLGSKLRKEQDKRHRVYTGSGHHCGVVPYSSVWCGGLPLGLMMNNTRGRTASRGSVLMVVLSLLRGRFEMPLYYGG